MAQRLDHNESGGMSPSAFLDHYRRIRAARTPMESAVGVYRKAVQTAKNAGMDTFALSMLEKLSKLGEEQAALHIRNLFRMADWTGMNVGQKQMELFTSTEEQAPDEQATGLFAEQLAEENGYKAGRARDRADTNPHEAGSAQHAAWGRGWHKGQAEEVMTTFGRDRAPRTATRRGRNPAAQTREALPAESDAAVDGTEASDAAGDETNNVVPIGASRGRRRVTKPLTAKQRKEAAAAAERLTGTPTVESGKPVF